MSVHEFELFHGCVITKILRSDRPITLRLIQTKPQEHWSTYILNDETNLFVSHSVAPRPVSRAGGGTSWTFNFSKNQLKQINSTLKNRAVYVALVCGRQNLKGKKEKIEICFMTPQQIEEIVNFNAAQQSITVRCLNSGGRIRVFKDKRERFYVPKSALDKWEVPGS